MNQPLPPHHPRLPALSEHDERRQVDDEHQRGDHAGDVLQITITKMPSSMLHYQHNVIFRYWGKADPKAAEIASIDLSQVECGDSQRIHLVKFATAEKLILQRQYASKRKL